MNRLRGVVLLMSVLVAAGSVTSTANAAERTTSTEGPKGRSSIRTTALRRSEIVFSPVLVSELVGSPTSGSQVSASQAAQQQRLLQELQASRRSGGVVVSLPEVVLFDFGRAELRADARSSLEKIRDLLASYGDAKVTVEGHTDDVGSDADNQTLSERRAEAVRSELQRLGVAASRLQAEGFGESRPVAANRRGSDDDPAGRQRNRRVEVVVNNV